MAETDGGSPISMDSSVADLFAEAVASVERHKKDVAPEDTPTPPTEPAETSGEEVVIDFDDADLDGLADPPRAAAPTTDSDIDSAAERRVGELEEELQLLREELSQVKTRLRRREQDISNMLKRFEEAQKRYRAKVREAEVNAQRAAEYKEQVNQRGLELKRVVDRMKRMNEQVEAVRRRAAREKEELERYGSEKPFRALLTVVDNFERALQHSAASPEALQEGVEMILAQLLASMAQYGVKPVGSSPGDVFDPSIHEAMVRVTTTEMPSGRVFEILQKGYLYQDRLLRASLVSVSQLDATAARPATPESQPDDTLGATDDDAPPPSLSGLQTPESEPGTSLSGLRPQATTPSEPTGASVSVSSSGELTADPTAEAAEAARVATPEEAPDPKG